MKDSSELAQILKVPGASLALTAIVLLLTWRTYRFTIRPRLFPTEPKELPYWIPFVGHVGGFFSDFNGAVEKGRKYFATGEPFAMTVFGQTIYVATSPKDISAVWSSSRTISLDPIARDMLVQAGVSKPACDALFEPKEFKVRGKMTTTKANDVVIRLHEEQLHPGPKLEELMTHVISDMLAALESSNVEGTASHRGAYPSTVSLLELCENVFIRGETLAMFGPKLLEPEANRPSTLQSFMDWEYANWKLLFKLPGFLSHDTLKAKNELATAFADYFRTPQAERPGASFFVIEVEKLLRETGLDETDMGKFILFQYWAIVGNVYKLGFWLVAHLLQHPSLIGDIRKEVTPAVRKDAVDEAYLAEKCPRLDALISETLRLTVTSSLGRVIMRDSVIGGKTMRAGHTIMLPIRELHYSSQAFESPGLLVADRFASNPRLSKSPSFRPWGGGHTLCPGRFLARRSVAAFVAVMLVRYDLESADELPRSDGARPSPGVVPVRRGDDVAMKIKKRVHDSQLKA